MGFAPFLDSIHKYKICSPNISLLQNANGLMQKNLKKKEKKNGEWLPLPSVSENALTKDVIGSCGFITWLWCWPHQHQMGTKVWLVCSSAQYIFVHATGMGQLHNRVTDIYSTKKLEQKACMATGIGIRIPFLPVWSLKLFSCVCLDLCTNILFYILSFLSLGC